MSALSLGRMRHLDLLAMWHRLNPHAGTHAGLTVARLTTSQLVREVLNSPA